MSCSVSGGKRRAPESAEKQGAPKRTKSSQNPNHVLILPLTGPSTASASINPSLKTSPGSGSAIPTPSSSVPGASAQMYGTSKMMSAQASGLASGGYQAYGDSYLAASSSNTQRLLRGSYRSGLRMSGVAFEDVNLQLPTTLDKDEEHCLRECIDQELKRQNTSPPILPESAVPGLPPKEPLPEFLDVSIAATQEAVEAMREQNNKLTEQQARRDRERNNMAAKKSRETRIEALRNARNMLNETSAERDWLRMKLIIHRGNPDEWCTLPQEMRAKLVSQVESRVLAHEQKIALEKKNREAETRAERTRERQARTQQKQQQQQQRHSMVLRSEGSPASQPDFLTPPPVIPISGVGPQDFPGLMLQGSPLSTPVHLQVDAHIQRQRQQQQQQQQDPYGGIIATHHQFASLDAMISVGEPYDEYGRPILEGDMSLLYAADQSQQHQHEHDQPQWGRGP